MHTSILPVWWGHITFKDITETSDWACGSHISMVLTETGKAFSLWEPCFGCWGLYPLMGLREITCFIYFLFLFFPISLIHIELSSCKINALLHLVLWFPGAVLGKVELLKRHIPPCLVWLSGLSNDQRVIGSIPGQGTCLGCRPGPQYGTQEATTHWCFSPSLPLSLKIK